MDENTCPGCGEKDEDCRCGDAGEEKEPEGMLEDNEEMGGMSDEMDEM